MRRPAGRGRTWRLATRNWSLRLPLNASRTANRATALFYDRFAARRKSQNDPEPTSAAPDWTPET